jgi:hypothetical protein
LVAQKGDATIGRLIKNGNISKFMIDENGTISRLNS